MTEELRIPFDKHEMQGCFYHWNDPQEFIIAKSFYDTLEYTDYDMGSRTLTAYMQSTTSSRLYRMFYSEFNKIIPKLVDGKLSGMWGFRKHGDHYSLVFLSSLPHYK
jgi:hypothetical protein